MSKKESVKVVVRCRPLSNSERENKNSIIVKTDLNLRSVEVVPPEKMDETKRFTFDAVFGIESSQDQVYQLAAAPLVEAVLSGYNATLFAYGQTGAGKTFTMMGAGEIVKPSELDGVLPRAIAHIFNYIAQQANSETQYLVRASFFELYNENIRDLLNPSKNRLDLKESANCGFYVKDGSSYVVQNETEMRKLVKAGIDRRATASTAMNAVSSRSHSIFTITVEMGPKQAATSKQHIKVGKMHIVDLAGSERQAKTQSTGDRLKEAAKINLSLTALGNVIAALVEKNSHIPYRDSKLTKLLMDSLGGNSKTVMLAAISPSGYNYDETLSTLRYANRAKQIKNKPKVNEDPKDAMLREFQDEIKKLKEQLDALELGANDDAEANGNNISVLSDFQLSELETVLSAERKELLDASFADEEKTKLLENLSLRQKELEAEKSEREALAKKLEQMQAKLLVGGVNIMDQLEEDQKLIQEQAKFLELQRKKEEELQNQLAEQELQLLKAEETFSSLQEEANAKTVKLKKLWQVVMNEKQDLIDAQAEIDRDREELQETIQKLVSELKYKTLIVQSYIPESYRRWIEQNAKYNENGGSWEIPNGHLAGNLLNEKRSDEGRGRQRHNLETNGENIRKLFQDQIYLFPNSLLSYEDIAKSKSKERTDNEHNERPETKSQDRILATARTHFF